MYFDMLDYTSYEQIRAVLGVSSHELSDETLGLELYSNLLMVRLMSITGTIAGTTASLLTLVQGIKMKASPTTEEQMLAALVPPLATYMVAEACLSGLSLFALKSETDGESIQTRFSSEATFREVGGNVRQAINSLLAQVDQLLGGASTTAALPVFSAVSPIIDVVTNEST